MSTTTDSYLALRARHEAMRLRRRMLSPGGPERLTDTQVPSQEPYTGPADQRFILDHLDLVEPFEELITHLYRSLFDRHPSMRSLFPASMAYQRAHLAAAFRYLIEHLDRPDEITATFARLGRDHRKLGLLPAQYTAFEAALCDALRIQAGMHWTAELEQAWVRMLRTGVDAMVRAADDALHEPPCWNATVTDHQLRGPDLAVFRVRPHEEYRHRGGQHVALESPHLPHTWRRFYPVRVPGGEGELEFHVRRTGTGGVSDALVRGTGPGDVLRIGPPEGNLAPADPAAVGGMLLVAWDTGWAAMKALLRDVEHSRALSVGGRRVRLFVGADPRTGLYDADGVAELERHRSWLTVVPVTGGGAGEEPYGHLVRAVTEVADRALVAGPAGAVRAVTAALGRAGVRAGDVRHDLPPGSV
ncbi:globin domain-containing protein [Streptomyces sp. NPDC006186]|uniref:nitric oxide dioxygenase n=1 Tax=Streptomyces thermocoprophilus TaxID=78356 RepID=A0ABV5VMG5_9ACTN